GAARLVPRQGRDVRPDGVGLLSPGQRRPAHRLGLRPRPGSEERHRLVDHGVRLHHRRHRRRLGHRLHDRSAGMSTFRTPLGRARGLGSAKHGVGHWLSERVAAVALVPLLVWLGYAVLTLARLDYYGAVEWVGRPLNATL